MTLSKFALVTIIMDFYTLLLLFLIEIEQILGFVNVVIHYEVCTHQNLEIVIKKLLSHLDNFERYRNVESIYLLSVERYVVLHQTRLAKNQSAPIGEETKKHFFCWVRIIVHWADGSENGSRMSKNRSVC